MTNPQDTIPANPAQVTDAMVEAACAAYAKATGYYVSFHPGLKSESADKMRLGMRAALTAAIGAGGQAVASVVPQGCTGTTLAFDPGVLHVNKDGSGYIAVDEDAWQLEDDRCEGPDGPEGSVHWITRLDASEMQALRDFLNGAPRPHPAPSGQAVVEDWQRIDDALVSCAGLLRTLCKDEIGDTAATELEYVRSALSNTPAQPGWRSMDSAPKDGTQFIAGRYWPSGNFDVARYRWEGPPNFWNSVGGCTCIRPEYQDGYLWMPLPAAPQPKGE